MTVRTRCALAAVAVTLTACTGTTGAPPDDEAGTSTTSATSNVTSSTGGCGAVEHPTVQLSSHLIGDAEPPGPFSSVPPTSGWHTAAVPAPGVVAEPLQDAEIVSALENGIVVLAVASDTLAALDEGVVEDLVAPFPDRLLVTAYPTEMPTAVALLTWGRLQRCDAVDAAAVTRFVLAERVTTESR